MKRKLQYRVDKRIVEREISYIPARYIVAMLITVLEVVLIIGVVFALCYFVPYFYIAAWLTQIGCVLRIVSSDDNPDYKVPWLLFVLVLPVAGFMLYFIFSSRTLKKKYVKRLEALKESRYRYDGSALHDALAASDPVAANQARLLCHIAESHLFPAVGEEYFPVGEAMMVRLLEDLRAARHFIYMEYFIIEEGLFWDTILAVLEEKAAAGVDVRVLYDDVGCMATLPGNYARILQKKGIHATGFSRLRGQADSEFNNRSHRKITVIDGRVAYTGGINIADEYINAKQKLGHWKDTAMRFEGPAVLEMTRMFLVDYGINVKAEQMPDYDPYPTDHPCNGEGYMIPFGDGPAPLYSHRVGKTLLINMLAGAVSYAWFTTPYLIIDNELCGALASAALRGVDVRIVVPHIPDKRIVFAMTRSFYPRLLRAGVKIYEYEPGFVHAKSYLVDGKYAMIGTINMDYRSLVHHFENGVWLYRSAVINDMRADMEDTLQKSIPVGEDMIKTNFLQKLFRAVVRIFSPLM